MNILTQFLDEVPRLGHATAIVDARGRSISFHDLAARSAKLAGAWQKRGLRSGDRVLLAMGLGIDLYVALAALWRIGAVVVFPEPALGLKGLRHAVRVTKPRAFLAAGWYRALGVVLPELWRVPLRLTPAHAGAAEAPLAQLDAEHPALISFTSGSTGAPKAIVRSHAFLAAQNARVSELLHPGARREVDLVAFPVFVVANLGMGVASVLPNWNLKRHDEADAAAIARHVAAHGVTRALLPPSVLARLAEAPVLPNLSAIFTGGGPVYPELMQKLQAALPHARIVAVYGSTEAEPIAHLDVSDVREADWAAMTAGAGLLAGTPIPQIGLKLIDDEIVVTGDHVNKGYLNPEHDAANKINIDGAVWHRTGDAGRLDADGRLWLLGRHEARVGRIYPFAIEVAARSWPGVRQAGLVAVGGKPTLAVEGDVAEVAAWQARAAALGDVVVVPVRSIPLDRRHRSKVDYHALAALLSDRP